MASPFDLGNLGPMLSGFKEKLGQIREDAEQARFEGQSGGGLVKVICTGKMEVIRVTIAPHVAVATDDDRAMLEDLITAAVNDATRRAREALAERMKAVTGGLPIPPGLLGF